MVQTLEAIRGGGGSVKIGTTGTIGALMTREIESAKSASLPTSDITPKKPQSRASSDEASSSSTSTRQKQHYSGRTNQIPMLAADNISLEGTPVRQKPVKKGPIAVVEIVDVKCGNVNPIANRLKKLGFLKLSDNI